jgi:Family of unknown function (DUF6232)
MKTETIDVGVRQRVLWVGSEAYPLQNIARVSSAEVVYRKGLAVGKFVGLTVLWIVLGVAVLVALFVVNVLNTDADTSTAIKVIGVIVGVLVFIQFVRLVRILARGKLWALVVETAGTSHRAVISNDRNLVQTLVREIVTAINDPAATFSHTINNYVMGDQYNQHGKYSTGRVG